MTDIQFPLPNSINDVEEGNEFAPRFDDAGLIPAVAIDADTNAPLMFAYMNRQSLALTLDTGLAHYYSRSRKSLWKKGETSGQLQHIERMRTDCDQDVLVLEVRVAGNGAVCHTGRATCFYRQVNSDRSLTTIDNVRKIDPDATYGKK